MAYDEDLADRIRELVAGEKGLTEQKMFGGLAFLIGGNMAVAASGQGGVLVRVDPDASDELVATTPASLMEMRGRSMRGWLRVEVDDVSTEAELAAWVERGTAYAPIAPGEAVAARIRWPCGWRRRTSRPRCACPASPVATSRSAPRRRVRSPPPSRRRRS